MHWRKALRIVVTLGAVGALTLLVRHVGVGVFLELLRAALPWLPVLLLLEGVRIGADLYALRELCGDDARRVPLGAWIQLHLTANACLFLPGGRAVSEGVKLARLGPVLGRGRVMALLTSLYAATILATALVCAAGAVAAGVLGALRWAPAIAGHALVGLVSTALICLALHRAIVPQKVLRWFAAGEAELVAFRATARTLPVVSATALFAKLGNRLAQVVQLGILLHAMRASGGPARALFANGMSLLGGALGELSPAQLGATEGALSLGADALSIGVGVAIALASLMRFVQLAWSVLGGALSLVPSR